MHNVMQTFHASRVTIIGKNLERLVYEGVREFRIPNRIPKAPTSTNKSVRFPNEVIEQVETAIRDTDCTFSAFVVEAVRVALENLEEQQEDEISHPKERLFFWPDIPSAAAQELRLTGRGLPGYNICNYGFLERLSVIYAAI